MINHPLFKNKTAQDTFTLYSAIILNILFGWALTKINTYYLSVEEYGQYAFFIVIIYFSQVFFTFGTFESASRLLAFENNGNAKRQYFGASFAGAIVFIIPFTIFLLIFSLFSDSVFKVKISMLFPHYLLFVGLVILQSFLMAVLRGAGKIKILSFLTFSPRIFYLLLVVYLIFIYQFTLFNSLLTMFIGLLLSIILVLIIIKPVFKKINLRLKEIFNETKKYGIHIYFGNILHEILFHSDKLFISYFLSANSMAFYGLAYMITYPLSHFSNSLATTLFNKFASQDMINKKIIKINYLYILITVSIFILLRDPVIRYLFSTEYLPAADAMLPLALAFGFSGLSKPYTLYLMAKGRGKLVRNISIIVPVVNISLNLFLVPLYGIVGAGWAAFIAYGLDFFLYWFFYNQIKKNPF